MTAPSGEGSWGHALHAAVPILAHTPSPVASHPAVLVGLYEEPEKPANAIECVLACPPAALDRVPHSRARSCDFFTALPSALGVPSSHDGVPPPPPPGMVVSIGHVCAPAASSR